MSEINIDNQGRGFWSRQNPVAWGACLTIAVFIIIGILASLPYCEASQCIPKWLAFVRSSPDEIGSTLSGVAGTLAFIWIIATVWLQSVELSLQRQEMQAQRVEFEEMAKAQKTQVLILEQQAALALSERKERDAEKHDQLIDVTLLKIAQHIEIFSKRLRWKYETSNAGGVEIGTKFLLARDSGFLFDELLLNNRIDDINMLTSDLQEILLSGTISETAVDRWVVEELSQLVDGLVKAQGKATPERRDSLKQIEVQKLRDSLRYLLSEDHLWRTE